MDPSPPFAKDLSPNAAQYIIDSVKELSTKAPTALVMYVDEYSPDLA
jgi:hypothetical protein